MKKTKNKDQEKYPGYPHYDNEEDIYRNSEEVNADPEHINRDVKDSLEIPKDDLANEDEIEAPVPENFSTDEEEITRSENEITPEDMLALGEKDEDNDGGEDELLKRDRVYPIDMAGDDLDMPEDDTQKNEIEGEEDEENQLYSLPDN